MKHQTKEEKIKSGDFVRVSATSEGNQVRVIFEGRYDSKTVYLMSEKIYNSIPLSQVATVGDFARKGFIQRISEVAS